MKIVAEIGGNHCGSYEKAEQLVISAAQCGADAAKIQLFTPDEMTMNIDKPHFYAKKPWSKHLYQLYTELRTPLWWVPKLQQVAKDEGIELWTSIYHPDMVPVAEEYDFPVYKVASFEIKYKKLIFSLAQTKKPVILSTGIASLKDIREAVDIVRSCHNDITLLKCTSSYPAPDSLNLATMSDMRQFGTKVGLSDHTPDILAAPIAVGMGADMIEKHLMLDGGPDEKFSLDPMRFEAMVNNIRRAEKMVGGVSYDNKSNYRRAMAATRDINKGNVLVDVRPVRATSGTMGVPKYADRDYERGDLIEG